MTSSAPDKLETAIRRIASDIADHVDAPISLKLWTGETLPLGTNAPARPALVINDPGAIGAIVRWPTLDRLIRLYAHGKIGFEGGTLIDLAEAFGTSDTRKRIRRLPKARLVRTLLPFVFVRSSDAGGSRSFEGDAVGAKKSKREESEYIRFHYDLSNDFYRLFLDEAMVYTCAYFAEWHDDLDRAQFDKLEMICRKLRLSEGDRFLDIGCGWGALVCHAARHYGVKAHGVTLSRAQYDYAVDRIAKEGLGDQATIELNDYRNVDQTYDKIASIGMYEAIGVAAVPEYLKKVRSMLAPDGLFLNHGITRRAKRRKKRFAARPEQRALVRYIFPGGELDDIGHTIRELERAGFEVHDVEGWREHYALTTKMWCERLTGRQDEAIALVGEQAYRIWVAYLAGCSLAFSRGTAKIYQTLVSRGGKGPAPLPPSRGDLYR